MSANAYSPPTGSPGGADDEWPAFDRGGVAEPLTEAERADLAGKLLPLLDRYARLDQTDPAGGVWSLILPIGRTGYPYIRAVNGLPVTWALVGQPVLAWRP